MGVIQLTFDLDNVETNFDLESNYTYSKSLESNIKIKIRLSLSAGVNYRRRMNPNSGQRMFRPTLMPMSHGMSSMQQQVVMSAGGGVFTSSSMSQPITRPVTSLQAPLTEHTPHTQSVVMTMQQHPMRAQRPIPKADLYLCNTSCNASGIFTGLV